MTAEDWNLRSVLKSWAISLTRRWKGSFLMRSSVDFWYLLISRRATVPGLYLWGFFTPPVAGADFLAALVASCFLGAFPPVDFLAVCLVRAMVTVQMILIALWKCYMYLCPLTLTTEGAIHHPSISNNFGGSNINTAVMFNVLKVQKYFVSNFQVSF